MGQLLLCVLSCVSIYQPMFRHVFLPAYPVFLSISLEENQLLHIITQTFPVIGRTRKWLKRDACVLTLSQCHKNDRKETICGMTTLFTSHQFLLFALLLVLHFPPVWFCPHFEFLLYSGQLFGRLYCSIVLHSR